MNYSIICEKVSSVARTIGAYLKEEQQKLTSENIELKGARNYVTYIDKEAERQIIHHLQPLVPEAGFLTEEETVAFNKNEYVWIIDPLDGTTNYVHHNTPYSVSIALQHKNETVLGVVFDPLADEMFCATAEQGAFMNEKKLEVSRHAELKNSYLGFGIPYGLDDKGMRVIQNAVAQFKNCSFRMKGSAALEICYVAAGRSDAYFHTGLSPWDVAAGAFILQCSGGKCVDFSGGNNYLYGKELIASNGWIESDILEKIIHAKPL